MDFDDLPEEAAFRAEVRDFLDANAERRTGAERIDRSHTLDAAAIARAKVWQAKKADAGFAAITWPVRYGGRGGSMVQQIIYRGGRALRHPAQRLQPGDRARHSDH